MDTTLLYRQIESLLFIAGKPLSFKKIAEVIGDGIKAEDVRKVLATIAKNYKDEEKGIQIAMTEDKAQMVTHKNTSAIAQHFAKEEIQGELSKPSIETLTIIAYRGPVSKFELERIRGINCSLILRNLMLRGLVGETKDAKKHEVYYSITLEFLKHLGVNSAQELPDYEKLRDNEDIEKFLAGEV